MPEEFDNILYRVRYDRELFSSILSMNSTKKELVSHRDRSSVKNDLLQIMNSEIELCNHLSSGEELQFLDRIIVSWNMFSKEKIGQEEIKSLKTAKSDIANLATLINELKILLQKQKDMIDSDISEILIQEEKLHEKIRHSYFNFLRLLKDYIRNLEVNKPMIAVIVPAFNEEKQIQKCLKGFRNQRYPNKKLFVVDNASIDKTAEKSEYFTHEVVYEKTPGVAFARNAGAGKAIAQGADILVFLDSDSVMNDDLLDKVWESVYIDGKVAGICKTTLDKDHYRAKVFNFLHNLNRLVWKVPHTFMFCTSDVFKKIRFWESRALGEDVDWAHRVIKEFGLKKFKVITDSYLITSARRFEDQGYLNVIMEWAQTWPFGLITRKKNDAYFDHSYIR